jgi:hypothetical protein
MFCSLGNEQLHFCNAVPGISAGMQTTPTKAASSALVLLSHYSLGDLHATDVAIIQGRPRSQFSMSFISSFILLASTLQTLGYTRKSLQGHLLHPFNFA